ncbi:MAG: hypothetical protein QOJ29_3681 [Thermoleophilaceae bacterium]|jgi:hypothetical protein|nr:hypothetical protein [Thermoleophilaceae bacterium]
MPAHGRPRGRAPRRPRIVPPHVIQDQQAREKWRKLPLETRRRIIASCGGQPTKQQRLDAGAQAPLFETELGGGDRTWQADMYVLVDAAGELVAGPVSCVSAVASRWEPCKTFMRAVGIDGKQRLLSEVERAEAVRVHEGEAA